MERKFLGTPSEFKLKDEPGSFEATFSLFDTIDLDKDVTKPGAFKAGQDTRISQWGHNWGVPAVGKGTIGADKSRAWITGQFNLNMASGVEHYEAVKSLGALQQWSYGYSVLKSSFGQFEGEEVRFLEELEVHEVSPVMLGAQPLTRTEAIKGMTFAVHGDEVLTTLSEYVERSKELASLRAKEGRVLSAANRERLAKLVEAIASAREELEALLDATDPEKGRRLVEQAFLDFQEFQFRRLNRVAS